MNEQSEISFILLIRRAKIKESSFNYVFDFLARLNLFTRYQNRSKSF